MTRGGGAFKRLVKGLHGVQLASKRLIGGLQKAYRGFMGG